ncbi:ABC transporter permease [Caldanaerobius polysaccharolyticus]|uniref:ABC transporter permease n=1 Tax=Caldanaerobius polysaccharolyticus TaxID=44256 RepID=UPI000478706C|nr:ABC transporter permease [Caldanaerobius polysaccharolyticus]
MKGYKRYIVNKIIWYVITFIVAVVLNFLLPRLIPGNPVSTVISKMTSGMADTDSIKRVYETFEREFGLDKPLLEQFFIYVANLFHGDMGTSFGQYPRKVTDILASALPWTIGLQLPAIIVGWVLGNVLGAIAAYKKKVFDKVIFPVFLFISCIPSFGFAIILVWLFSVILKIAPASGGYAFDMIPSPTLPFLLSVLKHYQLPFWSIVLIAIGGQSLGMREMSIYELNADYVKYCRLLGLKDRRIVRYVFKNAMLPQITGLALSLGTMVGGALVTEIVFSYPGIGYALFNAITSQDFPLISGCTLLITTAVLIANFVVDIIYGLVDPRIKAVQQE